MRFLLSRRWFLFAIAVGLAAWGATLLGQWQFHRLDDRRHDNDVLARNLGAAPVPIEKVMTPDRATTHDDEWKRVTATGTYDDEHTVVLKYQTRDSASGVDVVTPLVLADGTAVLVDRGWLATPARGGDRPETPAPPDGEVTVTGFVRANATGDATAVHDLSTRALSSEALKHHVPHELRIGFVDLDKQAPAAETELEAVVLPDPEGEGPHFFYGLQWWFFGALAIFGFFYLMYDEWRRRKQDSEAAEHPAVDRKHGPGDE